MRAAALLLVLGLVLLKVAADSNDGSNDKAKTASCPPFMPAGTTMHFACQGVDTKECTYDDDCVGGQKCCPEKCVNHCREPKMQ
ncbi:omwaprin-c-like [Hyperolius riggenbachi]|uniref:omwaprin-c-like n=1 Tax=Hyperolius riggenbachi TaxID=752182 RepID=UPI0035A2A13B